jgi:hypothetical protein
LGFLDSRSAATRGVVQAIGGDPLTLTPLFGSSDTTAIRDCLQLGPLQVNEPDQSVSEEP